jgi:hypothetical protein
MSIENNLDRIATALERIAAHAAGAPVELSEPGSAVHDLAPDEAAASAPAENPKKVVRLARSVATDPGVIAAQARERAATEAASASKPAATNGAGKVVSFEDMKQSLVNVKLKLGAEVSRSVMNKVGASNVTEIKPEDFGKVQAECARLMG